MNNIVWLVTHIEQHFESDTFDGIIAFYSLFHIPREDLNNVFASINRLLKNNGIFCFVVQLGNGEQFIDEPYLKEQGKGILYFNFFTKDLIERMLGNNNFDILFETEKTDVGENELGEDGNNKVFVIAKKRVRKR